MKLWGGLFSQSPDDSLRSLNDSFRFDRRMYEEDINGSIAYAKAIAAVGIISYAELEQIIDGLEQVRDEFKNNAFAVAEGDEDIHTAVERRLTELIGEAAGKLHTGRSRNDQVATDFRLWVMGAIHHLDSLLEQTQSTVIAKAEEHIDTIMPGYTHLQPAQPITAAHWLMSFFWMLMRDRERLKDAYGRASIMPLGSGALAGSPLAINRQKIADELEFNSISNNSLDAVSDRDFVAEFLFVMALLGTHLSRFAEDVIIYCNPLFGYITLDDRYSTGSSLMPQKRNADPMELSRGKTGRLIGTLAGFLTTLKGLPSGYNKDIQEDKESVFDSVDTLTLLMPVFIAIVESLRLNTGNMRLALREELLATDLADYLVRKGMPFRQAHHVVGQVVALSSQQHIPMSQLDISALQGISGLFDEDVVHVFDFSQSVNQRRTDGGTAPSAVKKQIANARQRMEAHTL